MSLIERAGGVPSGTPPWLVYSPYGWGVTTKHVRGSLGITKRVRGSLGMRLLVVGSLLMVAAACSGGTSTEEADQPGRSAGARLSTRTPATEVCPPSGEPLEVAVGSTSRHAIVRLPDGAAAPLPAVVLVHGFAAQADEFLESSGVAPQAEDAGVAVIAPQGAGDPTGWNVLGGFDADEAFITALLDDLVDSGCVDEDRVVMGGNSAGSAFAAFYGCAHPQRFATLLLNAGLPPPLCGNGTPNLVITHGVDDPVVPFDGGKQSVGDAAVDLATVPESAAAWADQAECAEPDESVTQGAVTWTRWSPCAHNTSVVFAAIDGWGHDWPGPGSEAGLDDGCLLIAASLAGAPTQDAVEQCR